MKVLSEQQNFSRGPAQNMRHCEQHGQCFDPFPSASFLKHQPDDQKSCGEMNKPFPGTLPESAKWHKDLTAHSHGQSLHDSDVSKWKNMNNFRLFVFHIAAAGFVLERFELPVITATTRNPQVS